MSKLIISEHERPDGLGRPVTTIRCEDMDGDDFDVDIHDDGAVVLSVYSVTGCVVMDAVQARELANRILQKVGQ